ncbi:MAG: hypothetical protein NTZ16_03995 [Verrucomicrobia bacterium]|nr:hypothetical protein [Verrucomicrobiota bacterium]
MNLTEAQKQKVATWINEGLKLAEIQKRLESEFSLRPTYMEVRFLIDDLKLMPKDPEPPAAPAVAPAAPLAAPAPAAAGAGHVSVEVDKIPRPGALVNGTVTFSDGQTAAWYLDQTGRLGLTPAQADYKPTAEDVKAFQLELQTQLQKMGF